VWNGGTSPPPAEAVFASDDGGAHLPALTLSSRPAGPSARSDRSTRLRDQVTTGLVSIAKEQYYVSTGHCYLDEEEI
jgi:hypothetical protein